MLEKSVIEHCSPTLASIKTGNLFTYKYESEEELWKSVEDFNECVREKGGEAVLHTCEDFDGSKVAEYDAIAFGCPAMGDEILEDTEFEPMFDGCKDALKGKNIALFGSYGWGDGEWMRNWEESCKEAGANLVCDSVICQEEPDDEATDACKALGAALV